MDIVKSVLGILDPWQIYSILIALLAIFWYLAFKGKISFSWGKLSFGNIKKEPTDADNVRQSLDVGHIVSRVTGTVSRISEIKLRQIPSLQMNYVEEKLLTFRKILMRIYAELLISKVDDPKNVTVNEDYLFHSSLVKLAIHEIQSVVRAALLRNHLDEMTEKEFDSYIEEKVILLMATKSEFFDLMYPSEKMLVSRGEIREKVKSSKKELESVIKDIFYKSLKITVDKNEEIEELNKNLDGFINRYSKL